MLAFLRKRAGIGSVIISMTPVSMVFRSLVYCHWNGGPTAGRRSPRRTTRWPGPLRRKNKLIPIMKCLPKMIRFRSAISLLAAFLWQAAMAQPATIDVRVGQPGARINPAMWGIFFEDINFGADGGLYAQLIKNRSFEFPDHLTGWQKLSPSMANGTMSIREQDPFN